MSAERSSEVYTLAPFGLVLSKASGADKDAYWSVPPKIGALPEAEIHLWRADLDANAAAAGFVHRCLAADELARAARFHFERDRARYITGRALLRILAGRYLGLHPSAICFRYGSHGKPYLSNPGAPPISFNVSNSRGMALYGFAREGELGVDLEDLNSEIEAEQIARNYFTPAEISAILALPPERRHERFFDFWTRKEAYVKALTKGLSIPLNEFDLSRSSQIGDWNVHAVRFGPEFAAALVAPRSYDVVRRFDAGRIAVA